MQDILKKIKIYGIKKSINYAVRELYLKYWMQIVRNSYSQGGEDLVMDNFFNGKRKGFYVDVGANDPTRFNNTKRFYKKGWRGINIEPDPKLFEKIKSDRSRDTNLN